MLFAEVLMLMERSADAAAFADGEMLMNEEKLSFVITSDKLTFNGPCEGFSVGFKSSEIT